MNADIAGCMPGTNEEDEILLDEFMRLSSSCTCKTAAVDSRGRRHDRSYYQISQLRKLLRAYTRPGTIESRKLPWMDRDWTRKSKERTYLSRTPKITMLRIYGLAIVLLPSPESRLFPK